MAKAKKLVLPREWRMFANRYGADLAYWYVPKGLAVTVDALKRRLQVLKEFEHGKAWRDCQRARGSFSMSATPSMGVVPFSMTHSQCEYQKPLVLL